MTRATSLRRRSGISTFEAVLAVAAATFTVAAWLGDHNSGQISGVSGEIAWGVTFADPYTFTATQTVPDPNSGSGSGSDPSNPNGSGGGGFTTETAELSMAKNSGQPAPWGYWGWSGWWDHNGDISDWDAFSNLYWDVVSELWSDWSYEFPE